MAAAVIPIRSPQQAKAKPIHKPSSHPLLGFVVSRQPFSLAVACTIPLD
jgi:hypothetical protein